MTETIKPKAKATKAYLACGAIGCVLFILVFLVEGFLREGYDPLRHPISSLSIGERGWIQVTNFIVTGIFLCLFSIGLRRVYNSREIKFRGPFNVILIATGLIGAGIFTTDPLFGYPIDQPMKIAQYTIHGHFHDFFSLFVFIGLPVACFIFRKKFKAEGKNGWANYSLITAIAFILFFILASMGFKQVNGFVNYGGLLQRLTIITGWIWLSALSIHYWKRLAD